MAEKPSLTFLIEADVAQAIESISSVSAQIEKMSGGMLDASGAGQAVSEIDALANSLNNLNPDVSVSVSGIDELIAGFDDIISAKESIGNAPPLAIPVSPGETNKVKNILIQIGAQFKKVSSTVAKGLKLGTTKGVNAALNAFKKIRSGFDSLAKKIAKGLKIGALVGLGALTAAIAVAGKRIISLGADMQDMRLQYQTLLGSDKFGDAMLAQLDEFANKTSFAGDEINKSAKTLLAFGISAKNVIPTMKTIGDAAVGSGGDLNSLTAVFGKVYAKGKADTETLNQFITAGIPIIGELGKIHQKNGQQIYEMAARGEIAYDDIKKAFENMTSEGGVYADIMEKKLGNTSDAWVTFTDQLEFAATIFGETLMPLLKIALDWAIEIADELVAIASDGRAIEYFTNLATSAAESIGTIIMWVTKVYEYTKAVWTTLQRITTLAMEGIQSVVTTLFSNAVRGVISGINLVIKALNMIPKVDIDLVKEPEFVTSLASYAEKSRENFKDAFEEMIIAPEWQEANSKIQNREQKISSAVDKLNGTLENWSKDAKALLKERQDAKGLELPGEVAGAIEEAIQPAAVKSSKSDTDRLTRVGLYKFGEGAVRSLDVERNNLLKNIASSMSRLQTGETLA